MLCTSLPEAFLRITRGVCDDKSIIARLGVADEEKIYRCTRCLELDKEFIRVCCMTRPNLASALDGDLAPSGVQNSTAGEAGRTVRRG